MDIAAHTIGRSQVLCLIGNPVAHSISPQLHNTLSMMTQNELTYVPFKVESGELEKAIDGLRALNVKGFNITVPYKEDVISYLDECTGDAKVFGAVNTVLNEKGRLIGYNTDGEGFLRAFEQETCTSFRDKEIVVLGAGGSARSISLKICSQKPKKLYIVNRTIDKAIKLAQALSTGSSINVEAKLLTDNSIKKILEKVDIVINTTTCGMFPEIDNSPLDDSIIFSSKQIVYDIIYNPKETKFLKSAEKAGCRTFNGLNMLLWQGILAYEIWTGTRLNEVEISDVIGRMKNIL